MMPNLGGWIHNFAVTETQTHKAGYTIYKITSIVFPRSVPQALTCLTVWKRFHDVKRLHRELSRRHRSLQLAGRLPEPTDSSFFKRFDAGVIRRRKDYILQLLDFVAQHPALYKCHAFAQFFSDSATPPSTSPLHCMRLEQVIASGCKGENGYGGIGAVTSYDIDGGSGGGGGGVGAIAEICDKLDLAYDPHDSGITLLDPERDKVPSEHVDKADQGLHEGRTAAPDGPNVADADSKDYARFLTPMASIESDDSDYIYEAALEFSHAVQAEVNLEYKEAHEHYKRGVELLLNGSKDDTNEERKFIAKAKISKYLMRADDIHEKFLSDPHAPTATSIPSSNFQLSIDVTDANGSAALYLERPWNHLVKYKVVRVLGESVMQVQCITEPQRPVYVMKGIEKPSSNAPSQTIFLPQQVPYMVDLLGFFQSEQKIFLLLKEAAGGRLYDYLQQYMPVTRARMAASEKNYSDLFPEVAEGSAGKETPQESENLSSTVTPSPDAAAILPPTEATEVLDLVRSSKELLQSVSNTLKSVQELDADARKDPESPKEQQEQLPPASPSVCSTQLPEASLKHWASELAVAIQCLHNKGVILGDLHMENLLLGSRGQLLITYFYQNEGAICADGAAVLQQQQQQQQQRKAFHPAAVVGHFVAPERPLTIKSDWWSYGVVLYQLLLGLSFAEAHPGHIELYGCVQYPEEHELSTQAVDLLDNLLQLTPECRFGYEQVRSHAFFKGTNWEEVRRNGCNVGTAPATATATANVCN